MMIGCVSISRFSVFFVFPRPPPTLISRTIIRCAFCRFNLFIETIIACGRSGSWWMLGDLTPPDNGNLVIWLLLYVVGLQSAVNKDFESSRGDARRLFICSRLQPRVVGKTSLFKRRASVKQWRILYGRSEGKRNKNPDRLLKICKENKFFFFQNSGCELHNKLVHG